MSKYDARQHNPWKADHVTGNADSVTTRDVMARHERARDKTYLGGAVNH
jgi:hypothetical protein